MDETLDHLGYCLMELAGLHPIERCEALNQSLLYYLRNTKNEVRYDVLPEESFVTYVRLQLKSPLSTVSDRALVHSALEKLTVQERQALGWHEHVIEAFDEA